MAPSLICSIPPPVLAGSGSTGHARATLSFGFNQFAPR